jgi:hypothetical protein
MNNEAIRWNTVTPEDVRWLWKSFIPLGKLSFVQGDPREGKTTTLSPLPLRSREGKRSQRTRIRHRQKE